MATVFITNPTDKMDFFSRRAVDALSPFADLRFNKENFDLQTPELIAAAQGCDVIIAFRQTMGEETLFAALPRLAAFVRCAVDIRTVDVAAASRHGVLVTQTTRAHDAPVSEWMIGAMLDLSRRISDGVMAYRTSQEPVIGMGRELRGSTLGVIGFGAIAQYLARLGLAFGMRVKVFDPYKRVDQPGVQQSDSLHSLLSESDYVACLAVATSETENMMDAKAFAAMRRGAIFVNAARGNLVDEDALLAALDSGHLGGCGLDVGRAADQKPSMRIAKHPLVVASPHIGGTTPQAADHQAMDTVVQVKKILKGIVPEGAVNAEFATRLDRLRAQPA